MEDRRGSGTLPFVLGGLPKAAFDAECDVLALWFRIASPFWAILINDAAMRIVAFVGMLLLLLDFRVRSPLAAFGTAVAFAYIPYWGPGGLSIAGLPLLLWATRVVIDDDK